MPGSYIYPLKRVFLNLSGGTVTGDTIFTQGVSVNTLTGNTYYSGNTLLSLVIENIAAGVVSSSASTLATYVQPGVNISTGGTALAPIINVVPSPVFNNLSSSGLSEFNSFTSVSISGGTISGGTIFSGSTNLQSIFNSFDGRLLTKSDLSGATFTGQIISPSISATTLSGGTIYSGDTNLYSIFQQIGTDVQTSVQPGSNITTGGTSVNPIINVATSPSFNNITSSGTSQLNIVTAVSVSGGTISGGTLYSGSTNLYDIFVTTLDGNDITRVQPGSNITTGGTANLPIINIKPSPSFDSIEASGSSVFRTLSATNIFVSGGTISNPGISFIEDTDTGIYLFSQNNLGFVSSGVTSLYFNQFGQFNRDGSSSQPSITFQNSINSGFYLESFDSINVSIAGVKVGGFRSGSFSAISIGGNTILSAGTNLYDIFLTTADGNDITRVQPGSNITTGGTGNLPIINVVASPSFNNITSSGASSFETISGTTFISGGTNLYNIIHSDVTGVTSSLTSVSVQNGLNTYTGGTASLPTINISAATLTYISSTTISGGTIYSGSTNLYEIFVSVNDIVNGGSF